MHYYVLSAEGGCADAQNNLGIMFEEGIGVEMDWMSAFRWYSRAKDQGHVHATFNLGQLYLHGKGVIRDVSQALALFREV